MDGEKYLKGHEIANRLDRQAARLLERATELHARAKKLEERATDALAAAEAVRMLTEQAHAGPPWLAEAAEALGCKGQKLNWSQVINAIRELRDFQNHRLMLEGMNRPIREPRT